MTVDAIVGVQPGERVQNRAEHLSGFGRSEGTRCEDLGQHFVGVFGDDIEAIFTVDLAASGMEDMDEMRVREVFGGDPLREAEVGIDSGRRDQLDGGFARRIAVELGEKDTAALGAT